MSVELTTDVTLNGQTIDVTVYEDIGDTGSTDNSETISGVADGTNTYTLDTLEGDNGNSYWAEFSLSSSSITSTPIVHSATIEIPKKAILNTEIGVIQTATGSLTTFERSIQIGETGQVSLSSTIDSGVEASVSFSKTYDNPVVVGYIPTRGGGQSINYRIRNITGDGCSIFTEEPDDEAHNTETVCYLVVEAGSWELSNGAQIEAGIHTTSAVRVSGDSSTYGEAISFGSSYSSTPMILASLNSYNNGAFMATQVNSTSSSSFNISQEAAQTGISGAIEHLGWVAIETGSDEINGYSYDCGYGSDGANDGVDNSPHSISYSLPSTPDIVVHQQTMNGADGAWARGAGSTWSSSGHDVYAEEDQVGDTERGHADETFSWFAIESDASFEGISQDGQFTYEGIEEGYATDDLTYYANQWGGSSNTGEIDIDGTQFTKFDGTVCDITPINNGVALEESDASTSGYLMYSEESVHTRFSDNPPHSDNCDHVIGVRYNSGWEYDTNGAFYSFTPRSTDHLIAAVEWGVDDIVKLNHHA